MVLEDRLRAAISEFEDINAKLNDINDLKRNAEAGLEQARGKVVLLQELIEEDKNNVSNGAVGESVATEIVEGTATEIKQKDKPIK